MAGRNSWKEFGERFLEMIPDGIPGRLMAMAMEEVGEGERERGRERERKSRVTYVFKVPEVISSVTSTMYFLFTKITSQ